MSTPIIPSHLKPHVAPQHYEDYTPTDHAVWRYVMRLNLHTLQHTAHPAYLEGLKASGISTERIPDVREMTANLSRGGWGTVAVDGLIPGVAFFDFQGHGLLPIATDIRKVDNILYTPAPDILHEAAGHAPILMNPVYAEFVRRFGEIGAKSFSHRAEHAVFRALKKLTVVKESPFSTPGDIAQAELELAEARTHVQGISESNEISRLFWWTVEFGLIGDLDAPQIYGAGLLSSVGESRHCLTEAVVKHPFSLEKALATKHDVTNMQKELFVCESFEQLREALEQYASTMAFARGGDHGLRKAVDSGALSTLVFDSGVSLVGAPDTLEEFGTLRRVRLKGPVALAANGRVIEGQGHASHPEGFTLLHGEGLNEVLAQVRFDETLDWVEAGLALRGRISEVQEIDGKRAIVTLVDAILETADGIERFDQLDLIAGQIISAFPGTDVEELKVIPEEVVFERIERPLTPADPLFAAVREMREGEIDAQRLSELIDVALSSLPEAWLLRLELLELTEDKAERESLLLDLERLKATSAERAQLIERGISVLELVH
ncbi:aromatic amino acid hydroxylase [Exiguobacterium flavidum]|uniref:aromatic amino acid hydroxylase n=1 Tax=Exiguobacterium flavidum TaxID=2184695 RepID=UPI000DF844D6|nr:aromatic amino acid hydroxylase [Exiguobacterium flavidum]